MRGIKMEKRLLAALVYVVVLLSYSSATLQEKENIMSFELNPQTVASAELSGDDSGYGIHIVLSDAGWREMQRIMDQHPEKVQMMVNGEVITVKTLVGSDWAKEFVWYRQVGVNDFSKEEAEALIKEITQSENETSLVESVSEGETGRSSDTEASEKEEITDKEITQEDKTPTTDTPEEERDISPDTESPEKEESEKEKIINDKEYDLTMLLIPAGEYSIPLHLRHYLRYLGNIPIRIDTPFYIQTDEVTVGEFRRYVEGLDEERLKQLGTRWEKDWNGNPYPDNKSVENISWEVASDYARWLSEKTGWDLRLPTLQQWVVAVILYAESRPVLRTEDDVQPMVELQTKSDQPNHLLGNMREWSSDTCQDGRHRLLGENYMTDGDAVGMENCAKDEWKGVGFRLVRERGDMVR